MSDDEYGRGDCPVCGRDIRLVKDGRVGVHNDMRDRFRWPPVRCAGWGEMPKADAA